jgi:ketosteroid isomerase-like protein
MTTQEVANRLVELCRQGKIHETLGELYADNAVSIEPDESMGPRQQNGLPAIIEKGKMFDSMLEEFHSSTISDPLVAGDHFSISWVLDATMKDRGRMKMEEICVYKVQNGKIVSEQFFF